MLVFPNAKINIGLNVLRKRKDGFHDIETCMIGVDWCDILEAVPGCGETDNLFITGNKVECAPEDNLVMKALRILREESGLLIPPVDLYLHKIIPDGAGLGGGSSDAAFTIKAVNDLFALSLSVNEMERIASLTGSDCTFFIKSEPAIASGRGEKLEEALWLSQILNNYKVVIVKPGDIAIATKEAYSMITPHDTPGELLKNIQRPLSDWRHVVDNAFEIASMQRSDVFGSIKDTLYLKGAVYAAMTGSGSAMYGIFDSDNVKLHDFYRIFPDCKIHVGNFIFNGA